MNNKFITVWYGHGSICHGSIDRSTLPAMMDNKLFNVNGEGNDMLLAALKLVFMQHRDTTAKAWVATKKEGLILLWWKDDDCNLLPADLTAEQCLPFVLQWLQSKEAKETELTGWDEHTDHDGSNGEGWRVYSEDWGHVGNKHNAICAIKPVVLWFGK